MENTDIMTTRYVRKPLYVDSIQVTEENSNWVANWCDGQVRSTIGEIPIEANVITEPDTQYIHVRVQNPKSARQTKAFVGDWVLYGDRGYKVYTQKAFENNFMLADNEVENSDTPVNPELDTRDVG